MKKILIIFLLTFFVLFFYSTGTGKNKADTKPADNKSIETSADLSLTDLGKIQYKSLKDIPVKFSYKSSKNSSMLVLMGMKMISGQKIWDNFLSKVQKNEAASISIAQYYKTGDKGQKLDKPVLYVKKIEYDGNKFKMSCNDGEKLYQYSYSYLIEKLGMVSSNAAIADHGFYLVNDKNVSYHDLCWSLLSSKSSDQIDYKMVFQEEINKALFLSCKPGTYRTEDGNASVTLDENCRFEYSGNNESDRKAIGRYYYKGNQLILKAGNRKKYIFQIAGDGKLIFKSGKETDGFNGIGTKFIYQ